MAPGKSAETFAVSKLNMLINYRSTLVTGSNLWEMETAECNKEGTGENTTKQKHGNKPFRELSGKSPESCLGL